jgi:hypothetical protein
MQITWSTFWLDAHGTLMVVALVLVAFVFGVLLVTKDPSDRLVKWLRVGAVAMFAAILGLVVTGMIPDTAFASGATFSGTFSNDFGTVTRHVSDAQLGNFTGPLLFDMMEHVSLVVPGLAAVIAFLIWNRGREVLTVPAVKGSVLTLMTVNAAWIFVLGAIGVYVTKVLTFPVGG